MGDVQDACRHWLPMATTNLLIDYQCTIMGLTKYLPIMIGTNWSNGKTLARGTMHW